MKTAILTPTEDHICRLKILGLQVKEIADRLHRSNDTIRVHMRHIHEKLNINNEVEMVVWYIENVLKIDIRRFISTVVLLAILIPSIVNDDSNMVRTQRSARSTRSIRSRRQSEDYYPSPSEL